MTGNGDRGQIALIGALNQIDQWQEERRPFAIEMDWGVMSNTSVGLRLVVSGRSVSTGGQFTKVLPELVARMRERIAADVPTT